MVESCELTNLLRAVGFFATYVLHQDYSLPYWLNLCPRMDIDNSNRQPMTQKPISLTEHYIKTPRFSRQVTVSMMLLKCLSGATVAKTAAKHDDGMRFAGLNKPLGRALIHPHCLPNDLSLICRYGQYSVAARL